MLALEESTPTKKKKKKKAKKAKETVQAQPSEILASISHEH